MAVPIYQQIASLLRASIMDDAGKPPRLLPREQDLARHHAVARGTIRNALAVLVGEGLIRRTSGHGTVTVPEGIRAWQRTRHTRRIVILAGNAQLPEHPTWYWGQIYHGILAAAEKSGYACVFHPGEKRFPSISEIVVDDPKHVLGMIVLYILAEPIIDMCLQTGLPVVCVDHSPVDPRADAIVTDCFGEGRQAVEFLLRHGHRELFYVGKAARCSPHKGRFQPETDAMQMEAGYRLAARIAGLDASVRRTVFFNTDEVSDGVLADWLVAQKPRPTAGVIYDPWMFSMLCETLMRKQGIRCPEDISLITKAHRGEPIKASALYTDAYRLGQLATQTLIARASGAQAPGLRIAITSELKRGTTVRMARHLP